MTETAAEAAIDAIWKALDSSDSPTARIFRASRVLVSYYAQKETDVRVEAQVARNAERLDERYSGRSAFARRALRQREDFLRAKALDRVSSRWPDGCKVSFNELTSPDGEHVCDQAK